MAATFASTFASCVSFLQPKLFFNGTLNLILLQLVCYLCRRRQPNFTSFKLLVVDNFGAKKVMCMHALKGKYGARLVDMIKASVKEAHPNGKLKKGATVFAVVVYAAMPKGRCDDSEVKFDDNVVVLVDKQGQPIAIRTRVFGPVPHELSQKKHVKILTLAGLIA